MIISVSSKSGIQQVAENFVLAVVGNAGRRVVVVVVALASLITSGCFPAVDTELTGDWVVTAPDTASQAGIGIREPGSALTSIKVDAMVFEFGWNDSFIVAKQHPIGEDGWSVDTSITNWFIVEVETAVVHGPMTESGFTQLSKDLGIPANVTFTNTLPVPE